MHLYYMNPIEHESNIDSIEESMIYVLVFSENYASSTWCLDELTKILDCKKRYGRVVIPVFYKVDPSIVRNQRETYAEVFVKHEHRFEDKIDKVHAWKAALTEACVSNSIKFIFVCVETFMCSFCVVLASHLKN